MHVSFFIKILKKKYIYIIEVFSNSNKRFAAAYVKPNQRATLTAELLLNEQEIIRFSAWEETKDLQLRLCCDSTTNNICVWETEKGIKPGSKNWKEHTAICPKGTKKVNFLFKIKDFLLKTH